MAFDSQSKCAVHVCASPCSDGANLSRNNIQLVASINVMVAQRPVWTIFVTHRGSLATDRAGSVAPA